MSDKIQDPVVIGGRNPFFPSAAVLLGTGNITGRYTTYLNNQLSEFVSILASADRPIMPGTNAFKVAPWMAWLDTVRENVNTRIVFNGRVALNYNRTNELTQGFRDFLNMNSRLLEDVSYLVNPRPMNLDESIPLGEVPLPDKDMGVVDAEIIDLEPLPVLLAEETVYSKPPSNENLVPGDIGYFKVKA